MSKEYFAPHECALCWYLKRVLFRHIFAQNGTCSFQADLCTGFWNVSQARNEQTICCTPQTYLLLHLKNNAQTFSLICLESCQERPPSCLRNVVICFTNASRHRRRQVFSAVFFFSNPHAWYMELTDVSTEGHYTDSLLYTGESKFKEKRI